jgi:hypothetical protein
MTGGKRRPCGRAWARNLAVDPSPEGQAAMRAHLVLEPDLTFGFAF